MAFLSRKQLENIGFANIGDNVLISDKASIYNPEKISIANNVRIDDFVVISAGANGVYIGSHVHIAIFSSVIGQARVTISDFSNISSRVSIYSSNDDYSGISMTNPCIPEQFKKVEHLPVMIGKHVIVGSGSIVLPSATLDDGVAIGALSVVKCDCESWTIYAGNPLKKIKKRKKDLLKLEVKYKEQYQSV